jgi:ribonuclease HI
MPVEILYADGGVVGKNPSSYGGVFAWRLVADHRVLDEGRGVLVPVADRLLVRAARQLEASLDILKIDVVEFVGPDDGVLVSNNHAELMAVTCGLEHRPPGWSGQVVTDSSVTIARLSGRVLLDPKTIPLWMVGRVVEALHGVGRLEYSHVKGHPTRADLRRGQRPDGQPVSAHQHWCDRECVRMVEWYIARIREVKYAEQVGRSNQ